MYEVMRFRDVLQKLHDSCEGRLKVGTACSGTDTAIFDLEVIQQEWLEAKGVGGKAGIPMPETLSQVLSGLRKKGQEIQMTAKDVASSSTAAK